MPSCKGFCDVELVEALVHAVWFIRDTGIFGLEPSLKFVRIQSSLVPYFVP